MRKLILFVLCVALLTSCGAAPTWTMKFKTPTHFAFPDCAETNSVITNLAFVEFFVVDNGDTLGPVAQVDVDPVGGQEYEFEFTPPEDSVGELLWLSRVWTLTGMQTRTACMSTGFITPYDTRSPGPVDSMEVQ